MQQTRPASAPKDSGRHRRRARVRSSGRHRAGYDASRATRYYVPLIIATVIFVGLGLLLILSDVAIAAPGSPAGR